ncbi:MAG TPA: RraA family protein [Bradyrhizobium sp.]|nr:RraA family protein [Bradyrhizobium sp.]
MIGFRVRPIGRRVSAKIVEQFRPLPTANISDCMSRLAAAGPRLRPMHSDGILVGPAFTVKTRPGDNLLVHKALDMAEQGDVVVVDAGGDLTNSILGEIMATYAKSRGIAGIVVNGSIRDSRSIKQSAFPIFAAGTTHRGPSRNGPGEIGYAIAIDGMVVEPGDLIVADDDGIVCVPFDHVDEVYKAVSSKMAAEQRALADIAAGRGMDRAWVDKTLKALGCEIET